MDKPLKDWTLEDAKIYCEMHSCHNCLLGREAICLGKPCEWALTVKPKYTADEVALAKLLIRAVAVRVRREEIGDGQWTKILVDYSTGKRLERDSFPGGAIPSLPTDKWVDMKDIAESGVTHETD